jgi:hypothetical protein
MDDLRACADTAGLVINPYDRYAGFAWVLYDPECGFSARTRPGNICRRGAPPVGRDEQADISHGEPQRSSAGKP